MRIIAGSLKGRRIESGAWPGLRPTSDRLRETLFNILAPRVAGASVLDGFAGTGAVGLEALSRGAAHVTFVERDPRASALVAANVRRCGVESACAIIRAGFEGAARGDLRPGAFDLVLLDPPYDQGIEPVVAAAAPLLAPGGLLVVEHARRQAAPEAAGDLLRVRALRAGDSALAFYQRRDSRA
jgi:16S rRNA (guanine(966)-N(2))-methyltransferase RsmD